MMRLVIRGYSLLAYALFVSTFAYFAFFVTERVDAGPATAPLGAAAIDVGLIAFFGLLHSLMARPRFKQIWTTIVPPAAERSTYVLVASAQIALLCWQWRPLASPELFATSGALAASLRALQAAGWVIALASTFAIDHFELFGVRQGLGRETIAPSFRTPLLYRWVRHPLYFGLLLALWSAPTMTAGHVLLAASFTGYLLIGVKYEERDLLRTFGERYRRYQAEVPMLLPFPRQATLNACRRGSASSEGPAGSASPTPSTDRARS
jgi:protein-S-isoprenylcysteine O-methyltransferase Ste14